MSFLPEEYQAPKQGRYMRLQQGENKFRILSRPILGWEDWNDKTPVRYKYTPKAPKAIVEAKPPKHFWAMIVWNYTSEQIEILQITQATIRAALHSLAVDSDWGDPCFYDLKIAKSGQDQKTKYVVTALPHKPVDPKIRAAFYESPCNLEALFDGANPFEPSTSADATPGIFNIADIKSQTSPKGSPDRRSTIQELKEVLVADGIGTEYVDEYLSAKAKEKNFSIEQVITSCLAKDNLPKFKSSYAKWMADNGKIEEAIPF